LPKAAAASAIMQTGKVVDSQGFMLDA